MTAYLPAFLALASALGFAAYNHPRSFRVHILPVAGIVAWSLMVAATCYNRGIVDMIGGIISADQCVGHNCTEAMSVANKMQIGSDVFIALALCSVILAIFATFPLWGITAKDRDRDKDEP